MTNPLQPEEGMMGELKPCPFCGAAAFKITGYQGALVSITCGGCWVGIPHDADESEDETVAAWNTRTSAPPVRQGVARELALESAAFRIVAIANTRDIEADEMGCKRSRSAISVPFDLIDGLRAALYISLEGEATGAATADAS